MRTGTIDGSRWVGAWVAGWHAECIWHCGFGEVCRIASLQRKEEALRVQSLRGRLEADILSQVSETWGNGDRANRIGNTTNIGFKGIDARILIRDMHDITVSTQSACASRMEGPSHATPTFRSSLERNPQGRGSFEVC